MLVPELFARMRRDYPMIELKVMHAGMVRLEEFVVDGRVDLALLSELSRSRLIVSTRLAEEEMVLVTRPGARPAGVVSRDELRNTPLIIGDGLRAAMDALLAGLGIELKVDVEVNDHETIRLMVQQDVGAAILPHSSVARECAARPCRGAPHHRNRHFPDLGAGGAGRARRLAGPRCGGTHDPRRAPRHRTPRRSFHCRPVRAAAAQDGVGAARRLIGDTATLWRR